MSLYEFLSYVATVAIVTNLLSWIVNPKFEDLSEFLSGHSPVQRARAWCNVLLALCHVAYWLVMQMHINFLHARPTIAMVGVVTYPLAFVVNLILTGVLLVILALMLCLDVRALFTTARIIRVLG